MADYKPTLEHASRPTIIAYILMAAAVIGFFVMNYQVPLKRIFGIE